FFDGLFDFGWLSDAGALSFTRVVLGVCATLLAFGLFLLRVYATKYVLFSQQPTARAYRTALPADHALLIAIPMWVVAFATVLIGHALFPDETDFRILMPLPIGRGLVFGSKLLALAVFIGLFTLFAHAALLP